MLLNIILVVIIFFCALAIGAIFGRKMPKIKIMDVNTVAEAQADRLRDRLLLERLKRSTVGRSKIFKEKWKNVFKSCLMIFKKVPMKIFELEKKYEKESQNKASKIPQELSLRVGSLLTEAKKFLKEEKFGEAEKRFIEIISLDAKNVEAYDGLTNLYFAQKEFKQAKETALLVIKILEKQNKKVKSVENGHEFFSFEKSIRLGLAYFGLAMIFRELEQGNKTNEFLAKALSMEENNPKYLDKFIESCIILKQKSKALDFIKKLEAVNPENQKVREFYEKIKEI